MLEKAVCDDKGGLALMEILDYAWMKCLVPNKVSSSKRYTRDKRKRCNNAREHTKDQRQGHLEESEQAAMISAIVSDELMCPSR